MSKRVPNEERRVSTTFAVSQNTIRKIDELATVKQCSRSTVIAHAVEELWKTYFYYIDNSDLEEFLESSAMRRRMRNE